MALFARPDCGSDLSIFDVRRPVIQVICVIRNTIVDNLVDEAATQM
jgi:hypothetical protein